MNKNLYIIIGDNSVLVDFYLKQIINKIDYHEDNKIIYDLSSNTLSDIIDESSMMSLFSQTKVIIGTNFNLSNLKEQDTEYLTKYLKNINPDAYIILTATKLDARTKTYKIFKDNFTIIDTTKTNHQEDISNYVTNYVKDNQYKMSSSGIAYFISKVGNDLNNINLELSKLFAYKNHDKTITKEDIDKLVIDNIDNIIYEFTNAVFENNYDKIIKMYNDFTKENIGFDYLLTSLFNSFHQALIIKLLKNDNKSNYEIATYIGKKEFYVKKILERLYIYTIKDIATYLDKLSTIDINFKSGKVTTDMLKLFLLDKN